MNETRKFTIEVDGVRCIVTVALIGFWERSDVHAFATEQQAAVQSLRCRPGAHLVIADLPAFKLQSQNVVEDCARFIASAGLKTQRLALVLGPGLAWMQAKRMLVRERIAAFDSVADARAWLISGNPKLERQIDEFLMAKAKTANSTQTNPEFT